MATSEDFLREVHDQLAVHIEMELGELERKLGELREWLRADPAKRLVFQRMRRVRELVLDVEVKARSMGILRHVVAEMKNGEAKEKGPERQEADLPGVGAVAVADEG